MNNNPRIIVLTLAYNCEKYIEETLASMKAQVYNNYCHILIENGSTDGTRYIIRNHSDEFDERVIYLESDYNSFNEPEKYILPNWWDIANAKPNDYFTVLDSDDLLDNNALSLMAEAAVQYDADIVYAGCRMFNDGDASHFVERKPTFDKYYNNMQDVAKDWISIYGSIRVRWGNLYKCELFRESERFAKQYKVVNGLDTLQNLFMLGMTKKLVTISRSVINYRMRSNSVYTARLNTDRYMAYDYIRDESIKLLDKWNCTDSRTYIFVEECRESAMHDLVNNITESHENHENNCKLLYNILTDVGFAEGLEKYKLKDTFFKKTIETIRKNDELIAEYRYENFGMMLIYGIVKHNPWLFLAGLFHEDNTCQWGTSYIKDELLKTDPWISKIFPDINWAIVFKYNRSVLIKMLNQDYASVAKVISAADKNELQSYIDREDIKRNNQIESQKTSISKALDSGKNIDKLLEKVLRVRLLDKEVLNYTLLYDINKGNAQRLLDTSIMLRYVYSDDSDMLYMAALAFEYMGMSDNAEECLEIAMIKTTDPGQKAEIQSEIDRLKVTA